MFDKLDTMAQVHWKDTISWWKPVAMVRAWVATENQGVVFMERARFAK